MDARYPFLIFGAFGTGKTATLVEAIGLLVKHHPKCRILVCTLSNSTADGIARALIAKHNMTHANLLRFNALRRNKRSVHRELIPFSGTYIDEEDVFAVPTVDAIMA